MGYFVVKLFTDRRIEHTEVHPMFNVIPNSPIGGFMPTPFAQPPVAEQNPLNSNLSTMEVGEAQRATNECQTCDSRRYVDESSDGGVSFQTPTHISPEESFSAVRAHEYEHIRRDRAAAERDGREVIYQSVSFRTATCAECGQVYKAGGTARTVSRSKPEQSESEHSRPNTPSIDTYI